MNHRKARVNHEKPGKKVMAFRPYRAKEPGQSDRVLAKRCYIYFRHVSHNKQKRCSTLTEQYASAPCTVLLMMLHRTFPGTEVVPHQSLHQETPSGTPPSFTPDAKHVCMPRMVVAIADVFYRLETPRHHDHRLVHGRPVRIKNDDCSGLHVAQASKHMRVQCGPARGWSSGKNMMFTSCCGRLCTPGPVSGHGFFHRPSYWFDAYFLAWCVQPMVPY